MKKTLSLLSLFSLSLLLSSCKVNLIGGQTIDVPWYVIAVFVAVLCVIVHVALISYTYTCPECGTEFKPKWYEISIWLHINSRRVAKCPHCGRKGFCQQKQ